MPPLLCDLCDVEAAVVHCAVCAASSLGNLCGEDDAALHRDANKRAHHRVRIESALEATDTQADDTAPAAEHTGLQPTTTESTAASSNNNVSEEDAAATAAAAVAEGAAAAPVTPIKSTDASDAPSSRARHSRERSATGKLWASARFKLSTVRQFTRVRSLFGSGSGAAAKLHLAITPTAGSAATATTRRTSLMPSADASPPHCHLCSTALATIRCDTCKRDAAVSTSLYCNACDETFHVAHSLQFHFRQSVQEAAHAMQIDAAIRAAQEQAEADAGGVDAGSLETDMLFALPSALPSASPSAVTSRRTSRASGAPSALDLLMARSAATDAAGVSPVPATSPPAATALPLHPTGSAAEQHAALKIQSVFRGSSVRRSASRELTELQLKSLPTAAAAAAATGPASLAALAAKSSTASSASIAGGSPRRHTASSTHVATSAPSHSASASPSPSLRPLSGLSTAAAAASWVVPPLLPASSPTGSPSAPADSTLSVVAPSRSTSRAGSRVASRATSPAPSPAGSPPAGGGGRLLSATSSSFSSSDGSSVALLMARLDVLESRLRKESQSLQADRLAFEQSKSDTNNQLQREIEQIKSAAAATVQRELVSARALLGQTVREELERARAEVARTVQVELAAARKVAAASLHDEMGAHRAALAEQESKSGEQRARREQDFLALLAQTVGEAQERAGAEAAERERFVEDMKKQLAEEVQRLAKAVPVPVPVRSSGKSASTTAGVSVLDPDVSIASLIEPERARMRAEEVEKLLRMVPPRAAKVLAARLASYEEQQEQEEEEGNDAPHNHYPYPSHRPGRASSASASSSSSYGSHALTREELDIDSSSEVGGDPALSMPLFARSQGAGVGGVGGGGGGGGSFGRHSLPSGSGGGGFRGIHAPPPPTYHPSASFAASQPRSYFHSILASDTPAQQQASTAGKRALKPSPPPPPPAAQPAWVGVTGPPQTTLSGSIRGRPNGGIRQMSLPAPRAASASTASRHVVASGGGGGGRRPHSGGIEHRRVSSPRAAPPVASPHSSFGGGGGGGGVGANDEDDLRFLLVDSGLDGDSGR